MRGAFPGIFCAPTHSRTELREPHAIDGWLVGTDGTALGALRSDVVAPPMNPHTAGIVRPWLDAVPRFEVLRAAMLQAANWPRLAGGSQPIVPCPHCNGSGTDAKDFERVGSSCFCDGDGFVWKAATIEVLGVPFDRGLVAMALEQMSTPTVAYDVLDHRDDTSGMLLLVGDQNTRRVIIMRMSDAVDDHIAPEALNHQQENDR